MLRPLSVYGKQSKLFQIHILVTIEIMFGRQQEAGDNQRRRAGEVNVGVPRAKGKRRTVKTLCALQADVDRLRDRCEDLEDQLGLDAPWGADNQEYLDARQYLNERKYRLALDR